MTMAAMVTMPWVTLIGPMTTAIAMAAAISLRRQCGRQDSGGHQ
jgi:hypothetical protein